jgi:hypothetical protein
MVIKFNKVILLSPLVRKKNTYEQKNSMYMGMKTALLEKG